MNNTIVKRNTLFIFNKLVFMIILMCSVIMIGTIQSYAEEPSDMQIPEDAQYWCGHWYKVYDEALTPAEAKAKCESMGGYLATATTAKEYNQIWGMIESKSTAKKAYTIMDIHKTEEGWDWDTGEELCYTKWQSFASSWRGDVYFYYNAGLCLGWSDEALVEEKELGQWNQYGSYSQIPTGTTKTNHHIAILNGHLSFSMYATCSSYYIPGEGDAYHSLGGKGGMVEFNEDDVKNGYICEWGDPISLTSKNILLNNQTPDNETLVKYVYDGQTKKPSSVKVYYEGIELVLNQDYTSEIYGMSQVGVGRVVITGINRYKGIAFKEYYIIPKKVSKPKLAESDSSRRLNVTWMGVEGADKYDVRWSDSQYDLINNIAQIHKKDGGAVDEKEFIIGKNLKRATTYYVQVRALGDTYHDELVGEWSDIAEIKVSSRIMSCDMWGCHNPGRQTGYDVYQKVYGPEAGRRLHDKFEKNNRSGLCFGLVSLGLSIVQDNHISIDEIDVNGADINSLYDINQQNLDQATLNGKQLANYLKYAQILQNTEASEKEREENENNPEKIKKMIELLRAEKPVHISIRDDGAHSIMGLYILNENDSRVEIAVYDPNYSTNSAYSGVLIIEKKDGLPSKWSFKMVEGDTWGGSIKKSIFSSSSISYYTQSSSRFCEWYDNDKNIELTQKLYWEIWQSSIDWIETELKKAGIDYTSILNRDTGEKDTSNEQLAFWSDNKVLTLEDLPAGTKIVAAGRNYSVEAEANQDSDIVIDASTEKPLVKITPTSAGTTCKVIFSSQKSIAGKAKEQKITCNLNKGQEAVIQQLENDEIMASGVASLHYESSEGKRNDSAQLINPTSYDVSVSDTSLSEDYKVIETENDARILSKDTETNEFTIVEAIGRVVEKKTDNQTTPEKKVSSNVTKKKSDNPLKVKGKTAVVKFKKLKKKAVIVKRAKALTVSKAKGKVRFKLLNVKKPKFKKYFKVYSTTGNIKVKKKLKKGTYKLVIRVTASGDSHYNVRTRNVTVKIKVR